MAFINDYKMIDINKSKDLRTGEYVNEARLYIGPGVDGEEPDFGHAIKRVFNTEHLSLLRIMPDPGMQSPRTPGFVYHKDQIEIEHVIRGEIDLTYPNGEYHLIGPGVCLRHEGGQPHRMCGASDDLPAGAIAVFHSDWMKNVTRTHFPPDQHYEQENGYSVTYCPDFPSVEGIDPLIDAKLVYETYKICFAYVTLKPGAEVPVSGFVTNEVDQIILAIAGKGVAVYPDKVYDVYYDIASYNHAGQPYKYVNNGSEDLVLLVVYYAEKFSEIGRKIVEIESFK